MAIGKCLSDQCSIAKLTKGNFLMIEKWLETDLGKHLQVSENTSIVMGMVLYNTN